MAKKNMVVYIGVGSTEIKAHKKQSAYEEFQSALHAYTYNPDVEGKKQLKKNVPCSMGYCTGSSLSNGTVVNQETILSGYVTNSPSRYHALITLLSELKTYISTAKTEIIKLPKKEEREEPVEWTRILFIPNSPEFYQLLDLNKRVIESLDDDLVKELQSLVAFFKPYLPSSNNLPLKVELVKGGLGAKHLQEELGLAGIITQWSRTPESKLVEVTLKEYENPECDVPGIISANRWYFRTGKDREYFNLIEGYRHYDFGKVEKDKKYYGKVTPDVTYGVLYSKEPIQYLDKLFNYAEPRMLNPRELLCAGNMQYVKSKGVARLIDSYPGIVNGKDLVVPFTLGSKEDPTLIELIDPPGLSFVVVETMESLHIVFKSWLERDENNRYGHQEFIDITDKIFTKETNKKGDTKLKLHPDFKPNTLVIKYPAHHPKAKHTVPIMLSVGYDLPERNGFNTLTHPDSKVWLNLEFSNDRCLIYRTVIETPDWVYVFTSAGANVRVLNKRELGEVK